MPDNRKRLLNGEHMATNIPFLAKFAISPPEKVLNQNSEGRSIPMSTYETRVRRETTDDR